MARTATRFFGPLLITNAVVTRYTVPALSKAIFRHIHISNPLASILLDMSIGVDAAGTRIFDDFPVPANNVYDWYGYAVVDAAEIIQTLASVNNQITMTAWGDLITLG